MRTGLSDSTLLISRRARQALEQVVADWRIERGSAAARIDRLRADLEGGCAVVRVCAWSAMDELALVPWPWLLSRIALISLPITLLLMIGPMLRYNPIVEGLSRWWLFGLLAPQAFTAGLPVALLAAAVWPPARRAMPVLAVAVVAFLLVVLLRGWILPVANQQLRVRTYIALTNASLDEAITVVPPRSSERSHRFWWFIGTLIVAWIAIVGTGPGAAILAFAMLVLPLTRSKPAASP